MFESIKNFIKGAINKMFNKSIIENKMRVDVAISSKQENFINLCLNIYKNKAPWIDDKTVFSMNLGAGIASEFAKLVTIEFKSEISNNEFLNKEYQAVIDNIRNITEFAAAGGGVVLKPYISNGHIEVDVVHADAIYPLSFNSRGEMTACILPEFLTKGEYTYTRLEMHEFNSADNTHVITNRAFKKKNQNQFSSNINDQSLGEEIYLNEVEEWANISQTPVTFINVERPLFSYFKMPLANTIDTNSPLGVSIYARVAEINGLLHQADKMYSDILWEYEAKQAAVFADQDLFKKDGDNRELLEDGSKRLYKKLSINPVGGDKQLIEYSPDIRDSSLFTGLNKLLQQIEFAVGLAKGTFSDVVESDKTATEIKSSKQRSYQTVKDIDNNLEFALRNLAYAMWYLATIAKLPVSKINVEKDMTFNFDDSIVVDKEKELNSMFADVAANIIKAKYYVMKKYGVDEKTANEMITDAPDIPPSPFGGVE